MGQLVIDSLFPVVNPYSSRTRSTGPEGLLPLFEEKPRAVHSRDSNMVQDALGACAPEYLLAITNDQIRPPIIIQKGRNKQTLTHMPLLLTKFHLYLRKHVLQDTSSESSGKQTKSYQNAQTRKRNADSMPKRQAKAHNRVHLG